MPQQLSTRDMANLRTTTLDSTYVLKISSTKILRMSEGFTQAVVLRFYVFQRVLLKISSTKIIFNVVLRFYVFQRVLLKQNLDFKGWNSREFPRSFESTNLSRYNLGRETGDDYHIPPGIHSSVPLTL